MSAVMGYSSCVSIDPGLGRDFMGQAGANVPSMDIARNNIVMVRELVARPFESFRIARRSQSRRDCCEAGQRGNAAGAGRAL